jgi:hypothetical protein
MSLDERSDSFVHASPLVLARIAGTCYLLNIITSLIAFSGRGGHTLTVSAGLAATASYVAVTALLYFLFKPVSRPVSLIAALFSLAGCVDGALNSRHLFPIHIHALVFFGCYCLLLGFLILRSTFMPRVLGVLMACAGLGWLTFVSAGLARQASPYHYIMGGIGEGLFTLWLLVMGVKVERWKEQASTGPARA